MTKSMVERVARTLCLEDPDDIGPLTTDDGRHIASGQPAWTAWIPDARAAIEAMREPTANMISNTGKGLPYGAAVSVIEDAEGIWKDMIDAARGEG